VGQYKFLLTDSASGQTALATVNVVAATGDVANQCVFCHTANQVGDYATLPAAYAASIHSQSLHSACSGCHGGTDQGSHPGTVTKDTTNPATFVTSINATVNHSGTMTTVSAGQIVCTGCHTGAYPIPHSTTGLISTCAACHTGQNGNGTGDAHAIQAYTATSMTEAACQNCHSLQASDATLVANYNNSIHKAGEAFSSSCAGCHGGASAASANHPANGTYSAVINPSTFIASAAIQGGEGNSVAAGGLFCVSCHQGSHPVPHATTGLDMSCAACHTGQNGNGTGDAHAIQAYTATSMLEAECKSCHSTSAATSDAALVANYK